MKSDTNEMELTSCSSPICPLGSGFSSVDVCVHPHLKQGDPANVMVRNGSTVVIVVHMVINKALLFKKIS